MAKQAQVLTAADLLDPNKAPAVSDWNAVVDGAKYALSKTVMDTGRKGFIGLIVGMGKFAAIEPELSDAFDAPSCYTDSEGNPTGYKALRLALEVMYPNAGIAAQVAAEQAKLPEDKRDAALIQAAQMVSASAQKLIQRAVGFLYNAWKARSNPDRKAAEPTTPKDYLTDLVVPKLGRMAKSTSLSGKDQLDAIFFRGWIQIALENREAAKSYYLQHQTRVAGKIQKPEQKAGPVVTKKPVLTEETPETQPEVAEEE